MVPLLTMVNLEVKVFSLSLNTKTAFSLVRVNTEKKFKNQLGKQKNKMGFPTKELYYLYFLISLNYNENIYSDLFLHEVIYHLKLASFWLGS